MSYFNHDNRGGDRNDRNDRYDRSDRHDNRGGQGYHNNNNYHNNNGNNYRGGVNNKRKVDYDESNDSLQITASLDQNNNRRYHNVTGRGGRGGGRFSNAPRKIISGSMVPKAEVPMHPNVKLAMKVITTLGNYSEMTEEDDLVANIRALATIFLTESEDDSGVTVERDLVVHAEEISDVLVKCFSTLSIQAPIYASLLSLLHIKDQAFTALVIQKVQKRLLTSLQEDDVPTSKVLLKSLACLASCKAFAIDSFADGSLVPLLSTLLAIVSRSASSAHLSEEAQAALYLVASTVPWCVSPLLSVDSGRDFLARVQGVCATLLVNYRSPYAVGGPQAIFHAAPIPMDEDSARPLSEASATRSAGTRGAHDSLYEAVFACERVASSALANNAFEPPVCMISPWLTLAEDLAPLAEAEPLRFDTRFIVALNEVVAGKHIGSRARQCALVGTNTSSAIGAAAGSSFLRARVPIYDNETSNEAAACSSLSEIEKYVANHYFQDILHFFDPIVLEDGTKLGSVELMSTHLLAVFKLFPKETHVEYLLLELLFGVLLQQPSNAIVGSSVYKLILILCKKSAANSTVASSDTYYASVFPPALALIVNILYQMIPDMVVGSILDFADWFAFHLINTQLSWPYWEFWNDELAESLSDGSGTSPVKLFAFHFVNKLSKAVVDVKLADVLTDAYGALYPPLDRYVPKCSFFPLVVEEGGQLGIAVTCRKHIEDKISSEDLVEWFENDVMDGSETATTAWCSGLLLQAILSIGSVNNTLAGITGLLDRYSMVIRSLAHTEVEQRALLDTLNAAYGFESAMFAYLLDEMLRRSQVSTTAALHWSSERVLDLSKNTALYCVFETIVDRSIDFVKASVAQRIALGGGIVLDETLDLTPTAEPEAGAMAVAPAASAATAVAKEGSEAASEVEKSVDTSMAVGGDDEQVDYEEEEQREGKRQRRDEGDEAEAAAAAAAAVEPAEAAEEQDASQDPVWLTTEAVKTALGNAREVYSKLVALLANGAANAMQQPNVPGNALWATVAYSLIVKILRSVHGAERHLTQKFGQKVLLSDVPHKIGALLDGCPDIKAVWAEHFSA